MAPPCLQMSPDASLGHPKAQIAPWPPQGHPSPRRPSRWPLEATVWSLALGSITSDVGLTFLSPLGLRTEIWTRYRREIAHNGVARLFGFTQNRKANISW